MLSPPPPMLYNFLLKYYFLPRFTLMFLKGTCVTWIKFHFWAPLICQSVCLSVLPSVSVCPSVHSVFRTFLSHPLRYWLEIWYMNLSWHNIDQVWLLSCLTYFYLSYCPYRWKLLPLPVKVIAPTVETAEWILMKLGRDEVLMVPYKCCCFLARSTQGQIKGGAKIAHGGSPS